MSSAARLKRGNILSTYLETFDVIQGCPPIETQEDERAFLRIVQEQLATGPFRWCQLTRFPYHFKGF